MRRRAFTLVELLVVIGIIAVLIAILMPALANVREQGRRSQCASNLHQFSLATMMFAQGRQGFFYLSARELPTQYDDALNYTGISFTLTDDGLDWLPSDLITRYKTEGGMDLTQFGCPNYLPEWLWINGPITRIGFYLMAGRNTKFYPVYNGRQIIPPMKLSDPAGLVLASDIIQQGTSNGYGGFSGTNAPHGAHGLVVEPNLNLTPGQIGSQGGNFAFMDGSVRWMNQADLHPYSSANQITPPCLGYWPDQSQY